MIISNPSYEAVNLDILTNNGPVGPQSIEACSWQQIDMPPDTNTIQVTMGDQFGDELNASDCVTYSEKGLLIAAQI